MNEVQEIDVEQIVERTRENIKRRRSVGDIPALEPDTSPFAHGPMVADFAYLHSDYDINNVSLVSHRRILGSLVVAMKKVIRRLLAPILDRQVAYNAASTRVMTNLKDWVEALARQQTYPLQVVKEQMSALERSQAQLLERSQTAVLERIQAQMATLEHRQTQINDAVLIEHTRLREEIGLLEAQLRREMRGSRVRLP